MYSAYICIYACEYTTDAHSIVPSGLYNEMKWNGIT